MKYLRVDRASRRTSDAVLHYSELDESRSEIRRVEIFHNGLAGWASPERTYGETRLASMPEPHTVARRFEPVEISREEFESVWQRWAR